MISPPLMNHSNSRRPPKFTYATNSRKRRKLAENHSPITDENQDIRNVVSRQQATQCNGEIQIESKSQYPSKSNVETSSPPSESSVSCPTRPALGELSLSLLNSSPLSSKQGSSSSSHERSPAQASIKQTAPTPPTSSTLSPPSTTSPLSLNSKRVATQPIASYFSHFPSTTKPLFRVSSRHAASLDSVDLPRKRSSHKQKGKPLTQMILDLGQTLRTTCSLCRMSYIPGTPEDEALHKKFHAKNVGGVDFNYKTIRSNKLKIIWEEAGEDGRGQDSTRAIILVTRQCPPRIKRRIREVLEVADAELGSAEIPDDILWSQVTIVSKNATGVEATTVVPHETMLSDRYKIYLYILNRKCVGVLLAERITKASLFHQSPSPAVGDKRPSIPALLGISRIWTSSSHRRTGIATKLLDCARSSFIYGMVIGKRFIAFSQTTAAGEGLARTWFKDLKNEKEGENGQWGVYAED